MTEGMSTGPNAGGGEGRSAAARPWLKWALIASLAVNLLVAGVISGQLIGGHKGFGRHGPGGHGKGGEDFGILGYARTLDGERRKELKRILKAEKPDFKTLKDEIVKARQAAGDVLVAEPFDKEKLRTALDGVVAASGRMRGAGISAFLAAAENMTPEERRGLLEWWKKRRPHHFLSPAPSGPPPD